MRTLFVLFAVAAVVALPVASAPAALPGFKTPSGNIHCMGYAGELRCDIRSTTNRRPRRPASCHEDWGTAYATKRGWHRGRRLCVGDTVYDPSHSSLGYGQSWYYAGITCAPATVTSPPTQKVSSPSST